MAARHGRPCTIFGLNITSAMVGNSIRRTAEALRSVLPDGFWRPIGSIGTAIYTPLRFSQATGHWRSSLERAAQTRRGEPIPWYTYPAIDFLLPRDFSEKSVLEFGGGQSTLWWGSRAKSVLTIEQDEAWYRQLRAKIPANVDLYHEPVDRETRSIRSIEALIRGRSPNGFDIIVIDGHLRPELFAASFKHLRADGVIIFDNSEGYGFAEAVAQRPCRRIDFFGFAPGVSTRHCTSLVYQEDCFLLAPHWPLPDLP